MTPFGHGLWPYHSQPHRTPLQVWCNQSASGSLGRPVFHFGIFAVHGLSVVAIPVILIPQSDGMSRSTSASASPTDNGQAVASDTRMVVATRQGLGWNGRIANGAAGTQSLGGTEDSVGGRGGEPRRRTFRHGGTTARLPLGQSGERRIVLATEPRLPSELVARGPQPSSPRPVPAHSS